jgi:hypothetical protein
MAVLMGITNGASADTAAQRLDDWTVQRSGTTNALRGVACGKGILVAVGDGGVILTSTDITNWTPRVSGVTNEIRHVAFGNDVFVALTAAETVLTSSDGVTWFDRGASHPGRSLHRIAFGNKTFVAVGANLAIMTSQDGITWENHSLSMPGSFHFRGISYAGDKFLAGLDDHTIRRSTDGRLWRSASTPAIASGVRHTYAGFACWSNKYVGVGLSGDVITSPDGEMTWTLGETGGPVMNAVDYGRDAFVAVGNNGMIRMSVDGILWGRLISNTTNTLRGMTRTNTSLVAVGDAGTICTHVLAVAPFRPRVSIPPVAPAVPRRPATGPAGRL